MTLSIIIVNYNVKYFLEQCLCSVKKAILKIDAEVFVVDNNSWDGSLDYLEPKFPFVKFIINKENVGFSKANNKALTYATGKYILFLNPDTILAEDCFEKCISFVDLHEDAGAIGVKMIDGNGKYLKESKRGFPSPWVAFCKLSGLTSLFPRSKIFARYYLSNLSAKNNQIIDSISGAFLFARKEALDKTGGFDEQFFMYAEDIDLSYRIQQAGYKNYYLSETTIIHFKGESTKKDFHYIKLFYKAMSQFAKKYFRSNSSFIFSAVIEFAVWIRAGVATFLNLFKFPTVNKKTKNSNPFFCGDEECCEKLEKLFIEQKRIIAKKESDSNEIIFCEGEKYSFKEIIERIQHVNKKKHFLFHASNSISIIESSQKNLSGETFILHA